MFNCRAVQLNWLWIVPPIVLCKILNPQTVYILVKMFMVAAFLYSYSPFLFSCSFHWFLQYIPPPFSYCTFCGHEWILGHSMNTKHTHWLLEVIQSSTHYHLAPHCCKVVGPMLAPTRVGKFGGGAKWDNFTRKRRPCYLATYVVKQGAALILCVLHHPN